MSVDYTAYPTTSDVADLASATGVDISRAVGSVQQIIDAVVREVERDTLRQFVASEEVRYFNGSGTGQLDIDEFVSLNSVNVIAYLGVTGLVMPSVVPVESHGRPNFRLQIARGSLPNVGLIWIDRFPNGRGNIAVDAVFGYGSSIPQDLWESIAEESAGRLISLALFDPAGRVDQVKQGSADVSFDLALPSEFAGWHERFLKAKVRYKRPASRRISTLRARMV